MQSDGKSPVHTLLAWIIKNLSLVTETGEWFYMMFEMECEIGVYL